jgi:hypothetical protein
MSYTDEQHNYINYDERKHTKLLACAGSGKTRCIIARMNRLIEKRIYKPDEILMLTFSRFTRDDFMNKVKNYGSGGNTNNVNNNINTNNTNNINVHSIKTIDKFAKQIIDPEGTVDVSLLSYRLMKYLEETDEETLKKNKILNLVKTVFIDEAQDLNEIQYKIFCSLRDKLDIIINMVGDPNQNIYQFRNSSDKYLTEFNGVIFTLTKNFRSYLPIVDFSKYLRPFTEHDVICTKGDNHCKPHMMFYDDEKELENNIIELLMAGQEIGYDLSDFAILSPTRGRMRGGGKSHGLCFISNILYKSNIKFKQFYEESTDEVSGEGVRYAPVKEHVNILTYMGSKGLEWKFVILIDAETCLINKRSFDKLKHKHDQYLLYVACSRAVENMYIFSRCSRKQGEYHFSTNPWFKGIPEKLYNIDDRFTNNFFFPNLSYRSMAEHEERLSKLIDKLDCYDLDEISKLLNFQNKKNKKLVNIFKNDYTSVENTSAIFLSKYTDQLFHALYNIKMNNKHTPFPDIEQILEGESVVTGLFDEATEWYNRNRKNMTWKKFDTLNIDLRIKNAIIRLFDRKKEFNTHIVAPNGYYKLFILEQKIWIKNLYTKYLKCKNTTQIREILFHLMVVKHSIDTQHYYHIKSRGKKYEHILNDFKNMFNEIENYVDDISHNFVENNKIVNRWGMISRIEFVDSNEQVWFVKCTSEISLKHTIQGIISSLMLKQELISDDFSIGKIDIGANNNNNHNNNNNDNNDNNNNNNNDNNSGNNIDNKIDLDLNFINFIKGEEISYTYSLESCVIQKIVEALIKNMHNKKMIDQGLDKSFNDPLNNPLNDPLNNPLNDPLNNPLNDPLNNPLNDPLNDSFKDPLNDPLKNSNEVKTVTKVKIKVKTEKQLKKL